MLKKLFWKYAEFLLAAPQVEWLREAGDVANAIRTDRQDAQELLRTIDRTVQDGVPEAMWATAILENQEQIRKCDERMEELREMAAGIRLSRLELWLATL